MKNRSSSGEDNEQHAEVMRRRKASYDAHKATATKEKGLIIVHTGTGGKREDLHVIVTGRNAKDELIELADLVTEMKLIKHPHRSGIKAQKGIEY